MQNTSYEAPAVTELGTVEAMTQAVSRGTKADQSFPAGTPITVILNNLS